MTVKELKDLLEKADPSAEIYFSVKADHDVGERDLLGDIDIAIEDGQHGRPQCIDFYFGLRY